MALGLNRENDTPIGGLPEFRGNLQGGNVFNVGTVPVFDGEKFVPGINEVLVLGYGGLVTEGSIAEVADGALVDSWGASMPLDGIPLQMTVDTGAGTITVLQDGVYEINFSFNVTDLANNQDYFFELVGSISGDSGFGTHVVGSNNVSSQSGSFTVLADASNGNAVGIRASSTGDQLYTIISMSFTVKRIG